MKFAKVYTERIELIKIMANIKRIRLSNGNVYSIFDEGALRLDAEGNILTGNVTVDTVILNQNLKISELNDLPLGQCNEYVLVPGLNGVLYKRKLKDMLSELDVVNGWEEMKDARAEGTGILNLTHITTDLN